MGSFPKKILKICHCKYILLQSIIRKASNNDIFLFFFVCDVKIGVGLMVCQQFGGINGVCFYTSSIFESAGFPGDLGTIIYALVQIVVTALNALFLDKAGRKPLLLVSATGLVLGCLTTALSFYLKTYEIGLSTVPALAVTGILLYIVSFSAGMGAIPWVIMSEVFPINIKGAAGSLATLVNWFGAWAISFTFNFLLTWSSYGKITRQTYLIFRELLRAHIFFTSISDSVYHSTKCVVNRCHSRVGYTFTHKKRVLDTI
ncbi:putative major facilitator, sugar transporter, major facilitator superfamily [Helianthus annuus]|nr:putative major facilitator, sugar transporter, major facilitator superfamily [Helianthus annuus]